MTLFKKIQKSHGKIYKERGQPEHRKHLGILTKKKDFKQVAKVRRKIKTKLIEKEKLIEQRNPDEFYFRMLRKNKRPEDAYTEDQVKEFMSKDVKYLDTKLCLEKRKIEKMKARLTMITKPANMTVYVDDKNVDTSKMGGEVKSKEFDLKSDEIQNYMKEQLEFYTELNERLERAKSLQVELDTLSCKLNILKHKNRKYKVIQEGSKTQAPIVKFL